MKLLAWLVVLTGFVCFAADSDVSGVWKYKMDTPDGQTVTADMTLKAEGGKLTGDIDFGGGRKLELVDGTADGNKFAFKLKRERGSGGTMVYKMAGSWEGAKMTGTAETDMDGNAMKMDWSAERK